MTSRTTARPTARTVLVVEDDRIINDALAQRLRAEGYAVEQAFDGPAGVELAAAGRPDAVLLDVMLPGFDGHEVCRRIQADRPVPVLMLTARDDEADVLVGLGVGADDYLTKPFSLREVVAVHLTPTEFDLLLCLARDPGQVLTRERLLRDVWDWGDEWGSPGATRTVDSHVKARTPALVRTVVWSLLGLGVFGTLFASANPVFGSWVDELVPTLSFNDLVGRLFLAGFVFAATLGAAYLALNPADVEVLGERRPVPLANRFEWLVPVLVVDGVFVVFVAAQARALVGGQDYLEATTGLTYADYVHQGFGQLTLATALTVLVVWVASRRAGETREDRRWLLGSLGLLCGLTLLVVASALRGMSVYQDAYGFTTLRLFVDVVEGWLGFVVLSIVVAGVLRHGRWLPRIALISGAVALVGLAATNPDAWVAERNLDRYEATGKLDLRYLQTLSADATPVIVERLPADVAGCVVRVLTDGSMKSEVLADRRAWNLSRSRADDALSSLVLPDPPTASGDECAGVWAAFGE